MTTKSMQPPSLFVHGPALDETQFLCAWLAADGKRTVQLPVRIATGPGREVRGATLATGTGAAAVELRLDDTALGIALADRILTERSGDAGITAWLEGQWRTGTPPTLRITRWVGPLQPDELVAPSFARVVVDTTAAELVQALDRLGSTAPAAAKAAASQQLFDGGTAAIPLLIASLADDRPFEVRDATNRQDLPANAQPEPRLVTRTVGTHALDLLHRIVTPPPSDEIDFRGKVLSEQVLSIADWAKFWERRRGRSLAEIHAELTPLVNAYWRQRGVTQRVD